MFRKIKPAGAEIVLSDEQFQRELKKEIFRSDRRETNRDLGLVRLKTDAITNDFFASSNFGAMVDRLRISDSIGWYEGDLSILLPESSRDGSLQVANDITQLLETGGIQVDSEVSTYPFDDELVSLADEVRALVGDDHLSDDDEDENDDHDAMNGGRRDSQHQGAPAPKSNKFATFQTTTMAVRMKKSLRFKGRLKFTKPSTVLCR